MTRPWLREAAGSAVRSSLAEGDPAVQSFMGPRRIKIHAASTAGTEPDTADLRTAALVLAIERVATVALERGIWP